MKKALNREMVRSIYDRTASRYDRLHGFLTGGSDDRGRKLLVDTTVKAGNCVLDAGGGTGTTAIYAARKAGKDGAES
jgi:ubiquinone/menaquinone biosynthesis C-methylase UbiE